jgi:hypothetical protein
MANQHDGGGLTYRVFVSYSHDDEVHKALVREFCTILRQDAGLDVHLDQWADDSRRDWSAWALHQIREADFILAVASPAFRRRADGLAESNEGRGAQFEAALLRDRLTMDLAEYTRRILPVVLPGRSVAEIPEFLCPYSATHYVVGELTLAGVAELLDAIRNVTKHPKPPRGAFAGNPLAALHADLQAAEYTRPHQTNNVEITDNSVDNGVIYSGNSRHNGDVVFGTKTVHKGQGR